LSKFGEHFVNEFSRKRVVKSNHECSICKKQFESEDYLEFHMKQQHYRADKIPAKYVSSGVICPADLCDIFDCPEMPDKILRL